MESDISNNRIRVLMIGPDRSVHGGISAVVNGYYEAGLNKRVDLQYIGTMKEGSKVYKLLIAAGAYIKFCRELKCADIVHVNVASDNSFKRKSIFIRKAYRARKKIVIHQHGGDFKTFFNVENNDSGRKKILDTLCKANILIVLSEGWREFFADVLDGCNNSPEIEVLNNTINISEDTKAANKCYGVHKLLFLGRICKDKGIDELLRSFDTLSYEYPGMKLFLGGIFEDEKYEQMIRNRSDDIVYLGWVNGSQKEEYLRQCDILVLPSYYEGFPVSVIEGMAYGCCVVASRVGAIPEIIEDGIDGILIEPRKEESLTEGLRELLCDDRFMERIGASAVVKAKKKYNINDTINRLMEIYEK